MAKTLMIKPHTPNSIKISLTMKEDDVKLYVAHIKEFTDGEDFIQLIHVIRTMTEKDKLKMFINSPGGNAYSCRALINAMKACHGTIITSVGMYAASCGAYTWAYGDKLSMPKYSRLMFHATSNGDYGKTGKVIERAEGITKMTKDWVDEIIAKGILTEEDKTMMFDNKRDVWISTNELKSRGVVTDV